MRVFDIAVDRPGLRTIAQPERLGELGAAVGIDGRAGPGPADRDIDGGRIDGVGPERFQMDQDPIARRALAGMDRPHPPRSDVPVGEVGEVEHVAAPVLALDDHARALRVDRDHLGGVAIVPLGPIVSAPFSFLSRLASALIVLPSTARSRPTTSPAAAHRATTCSNSRRCRSQARNRPCRFLEKVDAKKVEARLRAIERP